MRRRPELLRAEIVAETRIFRIEARRLRFANGTVVDYERLRARGHGAVLVVPLLDDGTVLLVREYAGGVDDYELALPKGRIDAGEDALAAANRELMEEVGYAARELREIATFSIAPGYLDHRTRIVLARDLYPRRLPGDEPEEIEVVAWPLARLGELVARDDFTEARSIAALYLVRDLLREEG
ncbi:ADP compounds hydrolase NudE [Inmirania thermothiophila]|uniref:ADP-ribose diphosphatase n=1 Tax=Inmirania thermothiophila TaxID=1750597 RepID=A0A3N1XXA0_9GAMM|nr:ADP compounds hydrolase NudE [Inmirania thermothiophila]ROR29557.1 ADP-ribose diphosphatase [Inmirania thermothiophila]